MALRLAADGEIARAPDGFVETALAAAKFRVDVKREGAAGVRVCPIGEIDLATIEALRERLDEVMADGVDHVILDLRGTTFLDSCGLRLVMRIHESSAATGIAFEMIPGPPAVQRAFDLTGLTRELPLAAPQRT